MSNIKTTLKTRLILYNQGHILLLQQTKPNGGNYTLVGGTIESQEFARESLVRESLEEAGIKLQKKDLVLAHVLHKKSPSEQRITLYFKTSRWEGKLRAREKDKFKAAKWFDLDKLPDNLTTSVRHVLKCYRRGIFFSELEK